METNSSFNTQDLIYPKAKSLLNKENHKNSCVCIGLAVLCVSLSACSSTSIYKGDSVDDLPKVDTNVPEAFLERFKPSGMSFGGWLEFEEKGNYFKPAKKINPKSALVYFYRPDSNWSQQEIVAATIFLNGKKINSLINNHYYPIELPEGTYRLAIRRPIPTPPTSFQKGTVVDFSVQSGQTYFLKYAEQYHVVPPNKKLGLLYARPLIQMPAKQGLEEIRKTRMKTYGYVFTNNPNYTTMSLPSITQTPLTKVSDSSLSSQEFNQAKQKFSYFNPLTW